MPWITVHNPDAIPTVHLHPLEVDARQRQKDIGNPSVVCQLQITGDEALQMRRLWTLIDDWDPQRLIPRMLGAWLSRHWGEPPRPEGTKPQDGRTSEYILVLVTHLGTRDRWKTILDALQRATKAAYATYRSSSRAA